jgi:urate oxidase
MYAVQQRLFELGAVDRAFVDAHSHGFEEYRAFVSGLDRAQLIAQAGCSADDVEDFAQRLARHFLGGPITQARVEVSEVTWTRLADHAFVQSARERRTAAVVCRADAVWVASGIADLVVLKTTDSEFHGFPRDRYTTLAETRDRVLATEVTARWRGEAAFNDARAALIATFANHHSLSLQQTLYAMGEAVLEACPGVHEIRLSMPNKHHFVVDLSPFGLENPNEVFHADDRPYGLIEGAVVRDDAPGPGPLWDPYPLL